MRDSGSDPDLGDRFVQYENNNDNNRGVLLPRCGPAERPVGDGQWRAHHPASGVRKREEKERVAIDIVNGKRREMDG